jgi:hypothetical protein
MAHREKWTTQSAPHTYRLGESQNEASRLTQTCVQRTGCGTLRAKESKDSFIQFIKQVVTLASQKGGAAIDDADLSDNEKRTAKTYLNDYKNKTRRTITDNLRSAMSQLGPKHYG